eukprot:scaffold7052_cov254-Pinguiococcus_pyrenoidosus.AAC.79
MSSSRSPAAGALVSDAKSRSLPDTTSKISRSRSRRKSGILTRAPLPRGSLTRRSTTSAV